MSIGNRFHKGDTVRLRPAREDLYRQFKGLVGTVAHEPRLNEAVAVRFPGRSTPAYLPKDFVELVERPDPLACQPTAAAPPGAAKS